MQENARLHDKLAAINSQYLKEITHLRQQRLPMHPDVANAIGGGAAREDCIEHYNSVQFLPESLRGIVFQVAEEKVAKILSCDPRLKTRVNTSEQTKLEIASLQHRLANTEEAKRIVDKENLTLQERLRQEAAKGAVAHSKTTKIKNMNELQQEHVRDLKNKIRLMNTRSFPKLEDANEDDNQQGRGNVNVCESCLGPLTCEKCKSVESQVTLWEGDGVEDTDAARVTTSEPTGADMLRLKEKLEAKVAAQGLQIDDLTRDLEEARSGLAEQRAIVALVHSRMSALELGNVAVLGSGDNSLNCGGVAPSEAVPPKTSVAGTVPLSVHGSLEHSDDLIAWYEQQEKAQKDPCSTTAPLSRDPLKGGAPKEDYDAYQVEKGAQADAGNPLQVCVPLGHLRSVVADNKLLATTISDMRDKSVELHELLLAAVRGKDPSACLEKHLEVMREALCNIGGERVSDLLTGLVAVLQNDGDSCQGSAPSAPARKRPRCYVAKPDASLRRGRGGNPAMVNPRAAPLPAPGAMKGNTPSAHASPKLASTSGATTTVRKGVRRSTIGYVPTAVQEQAVTQQLENCDEEEDNDEDLFDDFSMRLSTVVNRSDMLGQSMPARRNTLAGCTPPSSSTAQEAAKPSLLTSQTKMSTVKPRASCAPAASSGKSPRRGATVA